jgi:hypothetical protein
MKASEVATNSAGSAMNEFSKYSESLQGKLDAMKASFSRLSTETIKSEYIGSMIDAATATNDFATSMGGLLNILRLVSPMLMSFSNMTKSIDDAFTTKEETLANISDLTNNVSQLKQEMTDLVSQDRGGLTGIEIAILEREIELKSEAIRLAKIELGLEASKKVKKDGVDKVASEYEEITKGIEEAKNAIALLDKTSENYSSDLDNYNQQIKDGTELKKELGAVLLEEVELLKEVPFDTMTEEAQKKAGLPPLDFSCHLPQMINRDRWHEMFERFGLAKQPLVWESMYGAMFAVDPQPHKGFMLSWQGPKNPAKELEKLDRAWLLNHTHEAWNGSLQKWLAARFPEPSPDESSKLPLSPATN